MAVVRFTVFVVLPTLIFSLLALIYGTLPIYSGRVTIKRQGGDSQNETKSIIEIIRGKNGIPHIYADSREDAKFGIGYVHAQDRLWQMDFTRRLGHGRLSEIFGERTLEIDKFMRALQFDEMVQRAEERRTPEERTDLAAYADAVNYVATNFPLPIEYSLLNFQFEEWKSEDSACMASLLGFLMSSDGQELLRSNLRQLLGQELAESMLMFAEGQYGDVHLPHVNENDMPNVKLEGNITHEILTQGMAHTVDVVNKRTSETELKKTMEFEHPDTTASNAWAVGGEHTASGSPLIACDPHLSNGIPSHWYLLEYQVNGTEEHILGGSILGVPGITMGRSRSIAWCVTNGQGDVIDFYIMKMNDDKTKYLHDGAWKDMKIQEETIAVRDSEDYRLSVRRSHQGIFMNDLLDGMGLVMKRQPLMESDQDIVMSWIGFSLTNSIDKCIHFIPSVTSVPETIEKLKEIEYSTLNIIMADTSGNIGYKAIGSMPIRTHRGGYPVDGSTSKTDIQGVIPSDYNPELLNPEQGFVYSANNPQFPPNFPYLSNVENSGPNTRATRLKQRLTELVKQGNLTMDHMIELQDDTFDVTAQNLLPILLPIFEQSGEIEKEALEYLKSWDFFTNGESPAAAIYPVWFAEFTISLLGDLDIPTPDLGRTLNRSAIKDFLWVHLPTWEADKSNFWCDDERTEKQETCGESYIKAMKKALTILKKRLGEEMNTWRVDKLFVAHYPHQLSNIPVIGSFFHRKYPRTGGSFSVNVCSWEILNRKYECTQSANMRLVFDMASPDHNLGYWLSDTGQSGNPFSPHYDDFLLRFREPNTHLERASFGKENIPDAAHILTIEMQKQQQGRKQIHADVMK